MRWLLFVPVAIGLTLAVVTIVIVGNPRPAPRSVTMTCERERFNMMSTTPGVIVEPVFICWRKLP